MKKLIDGNEMPVIGLGTWQLTRGKCINTVKRAYEIGYKHIDTAEAYGNEKEIGEALKDLNRDELFITSKVWFDGLDYDGMIKACDGSLNDLGVDYIDLYLLHWPKEGLDYEEIFKAFKKLKDDGKIKSIGVSNFTVNHLKEVLPIVKELGIKIDVNQVEFHVFLYQKELLEFCKNEGIVLTAYSPLARGEVLGNEVLKKIGEKYDKTESQVALRWLIEKGLIVIPKASSEEHLKDNFDIDFSLDEEDIEKIDNLNQDKRMVNPSFSEFDY